jgi:Holliday junction resolvase RusA-like endonuclease
MTALTITVPGKPFTQNDQRRASHWTTVRKAKRAVEAAVYTAIVDQHGHHSQLRRKAAGFTWPVTITIADHCKTANLRDTEACAPTVKVALDVLTDIGVWPDDSPVYVAGIHYLAPVKTGTDSITLTITDTETR